MQYGALLQRAWQIIWRNKIIWLFGFLAALGSGGAGGANFNYPFRGREFNPPSFGGLPPEVGRALSQLFSNPTLIIALVAVIVVVVLVIGLIFALIAALGHGAMVDMVREADETNATGFATGWRTGWRRMLPVFAIRFLLGLPTFLIIAAGVAAFLLSLIPLISRSGLRGSGGLVGGGILGTLLLCLAPALCIGWLLAIPLGVLGTLSIRALVLEGQGILGSIGRGWNIFTHNLGDVVVLWLIFLLIGIGVAIVVGLPLAAIAIAIIVPLAFLVAASPIFIVPIILAGLLIGLLSAAIRSVVEAFSSAVWTLAYRQFALRTT